MSKNSGTTGEKKTLLKWFDLSHDEMSGHKLLERVEDSLEYVATFVKQNGPFDGIFGFSQGGTMASLILHRQGASVLIAMCRGS